MYFLPYNKSLKEFSRYLRTNSTLGEVILWNQLKQNKMCGYTFYRQKPVGPYIVDFYCKPLNLVIEVDGTIHLEEAQKLNDDERQAVLEQYGLQFIRIVDEDIKINLEYVVNEIEQWIMQQTDGELYTRKVKRK
jgi:very-short-patch-repair endonuclease